MSSTQTLIRNDVVTRLQAAVPEVSDRVFNARPGFIGNLELPCICVYSPEEVVETIDSRPTIQSRTLSVAVELMIKGTASIDDTLDSLTQKVETELLQAFEQQPADGLFSSVSLVRIQTGFVDEGRKPIGAARMLFEFGYEKTFT